MTNPKGTTDPKMLESHAAMQAGLTSLAHLQQWLDTSGRHWLVLNTLDLVQALKWPEGHEVLMMLIAAYRDHRRTIPTGEVEMMDHPSTKQRIEVPLTKGELLETDELDRAIRYLVGQMYERNPNWSLEQAAL